MLPPAVKLQVFPACPILLEPLHWLRWNRSKSSHRQECYKLPLFLPKYSSSSWRTMFLSLMFACSQFPGTGNSCCWQCCLILSLFSREMICWLAHSALLEIWNLSFQMSISRLRSFSVFQQHWSLTFSGRSLIRNDAFGGRARAQCHHASPINQEVANYHSVYIVYLESSGATWCAKWAQ